MHFTPTSGSWLNMVEIFFGIITRQAIRRGTLNRAEGVFRLPPGHWRVGPASRAGSFSRDPGVTRAGVVGLGVFFQVRCGLPRADLRLFR